jgi:hypothetical protein
MSINIYTNWAWPEAPDPELQEALEAAQQTVVVKDRRVVGFRRYIDEIEYPFRTLFTEVQPQVVVFNDLWNGIIGWSKFSVQKWRDNKSVFVGQQYSTEECLPSNCRASLNDMHIALYTDEEKAVEYAKNVGRAVYRPAGEDVTALLAAVRDVQQRKPYKTGRADRKPYRGV